MPDIDPSLMAHRLSVDPKINLVKQRRRNFALKRNFTVVEEVTKCFKLASSKKSNTSTG
jgi:hypothetical protein